MGPQTPLAGFQANGEPAAGEQCSERRRGGRGGAVAVVFVIMGAIVAAGDSVRDVIALKKLCAAAPQPILDSGVSFQSGIPSPGARRRSAKAPSLE